MQDLYNPSIIIINLSFPSALIYLLASPLQGMTGSVKLAEQVYQRRVTAGHISGRDVSKAEQPFGSYDTSQNTSRPRLSPQSTGIADECNTFPLQASMQYGTHNRDSGREVSSQTQPFGSHDTSQDTSRPGLSQYGMHNQDPSSSTNQSQPSQDSGTYLRVSQQNRDHRTRPEDWTCPSCGISNIQQRTACFRCSLPAMSAAPHDEAIVSRRENPQHSASFAEGMMRTGADLRIIGDTTAGILETGLHSLATASHPVAQLDSLG